MAISVRYDNPIKLSSLQSIFVTFKYKQIIVDTIRMIPERNYNGSNKTWELPYDALSFLKEKLPKETFEIEGSPINSKKYGVKLIAKHYDAPKELKTKMFDYQIDGYNEMLNYNKYLLLDQQGLGKSLQTIAVALRRKELNHLNHCLIICGVNGLKYTWQNEIKQHTGMDALVLGNRKNRKGIWNTGSNADKIKDLQDLNQFFIITNVESLRNKEIKETVKKYLDKGIIDMVVVDEIHKCFDYNTRILTNKGYVKIGDVVENREKLYVASFNENDNTIEYKPIKNWFRNETSERRIKLTLTLCGKRKEIICTESHLFYTLNRGWVQAKDLTSDDDVADFNDFPKKCTNCGVLHGEDKTYNKGVMFCGKKCSAIWRNKHYEVTDAQRKASSDNLKKLWENEEYRKRKSKESQERMLKNNPVYMEGVVEKTKATMAQKGYVNNFKYGNGKMSKYEEIASELLLPLGFVYNKPINTREARNTLNDNFPNSYKPDFVEETKKICIEIDGLNHNKKDIQSLDSKKEKCLRFLGYDVIRFTHMDIDNGLLKEWVDKYVLETCK